MSDEERRYRVDPRLLTLGELDRIQTELGVNLAEVTQYKATAAMAWVLAQRDDPTFSFDEAMALRPDQLEIVEADEGERSGGASAGGLPHASPEPGISILSRS